MANDPVVAVVGLRALNRDLKQLGDAQRGPMLAYLKAAGVAAATPVADAARSAVPTVTGDLAGTIRVLSSRTGAKVAMGRKRYPYAGWVEFGGTRHRPHVSHRPYVATGRYLFPAARGLAATSAAVYSDAIQRAFDHFDWTNGGANPQEVHD
jgi:hypothetical protein